MEPGHTRLVLEIDNDAYEKLELLQKAEGRYKKALVADMIRRAYGHHIRLKTRKENRNQTNEESP